MRNAGLRESTIFAMSLPILEYRSRGRVENRPPISMLEKLAYVMLGVLSPAICFSLSIPKYPIQPEWQEGGWSRYLAMIPSGRVGFAFYPLLLYSMASLSLLVIRIKFANRFLVRLGLYTGIVLSLQYCVVQAAAIGNAGSAPDWQFFVRLAIGLGAAAILFAQIRLLHLFWRTRPIILLVCLLAPIVPVILWFQISLLFIVAAAPAWSAGAYTMAAWTARQEYVRDRGLRRESRQLQWLGIVAWILGYGAAWKWSIANAIKAYAALPTSAHCYIATAAASGHRRFVRSGRAVAGDGSIFWCNDQLRRLKCVEIAFAAASPATHRLMRRIYDWAGPRLARLIACRPLLADLAYATLKPTEWLAYGLLVCLIPASRAAANDLYPSV